MKSNTFLNNNLGEFLEFIQHDAPLSGRIKDINLNDFISNQTKTKIIKFVDDNLVVLIKNQFINDYKLKEFSNFFGELDPPGPNPYGINFLPEHPEINVISNVKTSKGIPDWKPWGWRSNMARRYDLS